ncbi:MAG: cytidylate kinase family protein [Candidatus Woesearchaeota archaeon]|nr:cytidylate kinase [Candidatus Woesearchaeota archaeon]MDP6599953.1 cytidylate kinase family protein [Candidatus Woesearchaeota archaeon]|tara:strand:+ start:2795 stop:3328 length:534 start_codon:yes stop_codon:yes gene_type:complete
MIITISGKAGSGKSTAAKELAKKLKLKHHSIGDLMRQIAKEKNMSLNELSKSAEKDKSIDLALDKKQIELRNKTDFVIDGRLTAYFIPYANLKVFLECNDKVRAERILKDKREDEKSKSINELTKKIKKREQSERKRYKKLYNVDYYDKKLYDLIIDTTNLSINGVLEKIIKSINEE